MTPQIPLRKKDPQNTRGVQKYPFQRSDHQQQQVQAVVGAGLLPVPHDLNSELSNLVFPYSGRYCRYSGAMAGL